MKIFLKAIILVPIAVVVLAFAFANRHFATISFDPFNSEAPAFSLSAPMFIVLFALLLVGILIGGSASWVAQGKVRRAARDARAEASALRARLTRLEPDPDAAADPGFRPPARRTA